MHRTIIQIEDSLYQQLRSLSFEKGLSFSALVRELLAKALGRGKVKKKMRIDQFKFIGCGRAKGLPKDISEEHDKYLVEDYLK